MGTRLWLCGVFSLAVAFAGTVVGGAALGAGGHSCSPCFGVATHAGPHGSHLCSTTAVHPCRWDLLIKSLIKAPGYGAQSPGWELGWPVLVTWCHWMNMDLLHPAITGCGPRTPTQPRHRGHMWGSPRPWALPPCAASLWGAAHVPRTAPGALLASHVPIDGPDHMYTTIQLPCNGSRLLSHQSPSLSPARPGPATVQ